MTRLFLAWKGDGNAMINVACSDDGGRTWREYTSGETTRPSPGLRARAIVHFDNPECALPKYTRSFPVVLHAVQLYCK